jgi:predicted MFS family arabinose efflux permease
MVLIDPPLAPVSVAFNTSMVFGGSAAGAALGSLTIVFLGLQALTWVSLAIAVLALIVLFAGGPPPVREEADRAVARRAVASSASD